MKKIYRINLIALFLILTFQAFSQADVTFKVDMSNETISAEGVHVVGSINGWNTTSNSLTQEGTTNIYSATFQVEPGWHEFKYLNGNAWGTEESASLPCAASNGNRFLFINDSGEAVVLAEVPFGGCNSEGTGFEITFNVDMSSEASIATEGVHMAGWINNWGTDNLMLENDFDAIYTIDFRLPTPADYPIVFEYKYINGNAWGTDEILDAECETVTESNRLITVNTSGTNVYDVFNGCNYELSTDDIFNRNPLTLVYNKNLRLLEFYNTSTTDNITSIRVYNLNGQLVKNLDHIDNISSTKLDFNSQANGLYIVQIEANSKLNVEKIIVH